MRRPKTIPAASLLALTAAVAWTAFAQEQGAAVSEAPTELYWTSPLVIVQCLWMVLVTVGAALYSRSIGKKDGEVINESELRGLNLPRGSLRGILALATIGSFVNVMVLGAPVLGNSFDSVLAAFGTLTGSIVGFYFGTRGATPPTPATPAAPRTEQHPSSS